MSNESASRPLRVLYAATYYVDEYVRQAVIRQQLQTLPNVTVETLIVNRRGLVRYAIFLWRFFWLRKSSFDVVYLGWRTVEIVPLLRLMTRRPLVLDAFVPIFETLCLERQTVQSTSLIGRFVHWWEGRALRVVDTIITDTAANADYFSSEFQVQRERFIDVPVGVDRTIYSPRQQTDGHSGVRVFFYGSFLHLHGVSVMVEAAKLLRDRADITWEFVGDGPERQRAEHQAKQYDLPNVHFLPRVSQTELAQKIAEADICLGGPFSAIPKAQRVVTGKTYQFLAMGKPVIVSDTPGNRELLTHGKDCAMVRPADSQSLANAVRQLADNDDLRNRLATATHGIITNVESVLSHKLQALLS